jgi:ribonuclease HI
MILAGQNNVQLLFVLGHKGTESNETGDQLARTGSLHPLVVPETACSISDNDKSYKVSHQEMGVQRRASY